MNEQARKLSDRLLDYGVAVVRVCPALRRSLEGRHVAGQLLRSATSAGANYEEACGAQSRAEFIHKLQIVYKEVRESLFWLKLVGRSGLLRGETIEGLLRETQELGSIIGRSLLTTKQKGS